MDFSDLFSEYSIDFVDHSQFVLNALLAALLSWLLSMYYTKYGHAVGNRSKFSNNFILLALTTMLIIYIVKSSIALSLGLVGALSIVRFRAAIKEPEELTYLFLVIGIGLGMGANQAGITILAFVLIMALLILKTSTQKNKIKRLDNEMVLNVSSSVVDEQGINAILIQHLAGVELRRLSHDKGTVRMSYVLEIDSLDQLSNVKNELLQKDPSAEISFIDNKNLAQ